MPAKNPSKYETHEGKRNDSLEACRHGRGGLVSQWLKPGSFSQLAQVAIAGEQAATTGRYDSVQKVEKRVQKER